MEKAEVTFKNTEQNTWIKISLLYDKESSNIDYDVKFSEGYSMNSQLDFTGFLADMFLNSLRNNE